MSDLSIKPPRRPSAALGGPAKPDLSITALYTAQTWAWAKLPYAELFATRDSRRVFDVTNAALALTGRGGLPYALVHRHAMIDHLLRASGASRVLELAAGLSPRGAEWSARLPYVEVDLPSMIETKRRLLAPAPEVLARLQLVAGDLADIDLAPYAAPFVIAEGLFMYLDAPARAKLFAKVRALGAVQLVFDLVPVDEQRPPGLVGRALGAAMKAFTGGRAFERDARTRVQILGELAAAGFTSSRAIAAVDVARDWQLPHADRRTDTVVFVAS